MKPSLTAGIDATREFVVDRNRTIDFMGEEARVYATPMLVRDIEIACRDLLLAHLDPGEDSVGTRIELAARSRSRSAPATVSTRSATAGIRASSSTSARRGSGWRGKRQRPREAPAGVGRPMRSKS